MADTLARHSRRRSPSSPVDDADAAHRLAAALCRAGDMDRALPMLKEAVVHHPGSAELWNDLGVAQWLLGATAIALECFERASRLAPDQSSYRINYGRCLLAEGRDEDGRRELETILPAERSRSIELAIAESHLAQWNLDAARQGFERALSRDGSSGAALRGLASVWWNTGDASRAAVYARAAVRAEPHAALHCQLARMMHYVPGATPAEIIEEHQGAAALHFPGRAETRRRRRRPRAGRLRVGYMSGLFKQHRTVLNPILRGHHEMEVVCFSDGALEREPCDAPVEWVETSGCSNRELAGLVQSRRIDVLVDCDGLFRLGKRLPVLAGRTAPVQISLPFYPGGAGVGQIDFRITDSIIDPPGPEPADGLLRVPHAFCYQPDPAGPAVGELPALERGTVTFGSLSLPAKINEAVADCWARILRAIPSATLLIQYFLDRPGSRDVNPAIQERIARLFSTRGINPARVQMAGARSFHEHLGIYDLIDIALDPFPFNGALTTLNALYMGTPVVALEGTTAAGRVGASLLRGIGLHSLVSRDVVGYCNTAVQLAEDLPRLRQLRRSLRQQLMSSNLADARRYASSLEEAYRIAWEGE